jgi:FkbM family methyltransferase
VANKFSIYLKKKLVGKNQNLISLEEPYDVMRDAGASHGHISERMLRRFPDAHAYAFEPNPFYTEELRAYAARENRFHPQFMALSDHEGIAELHVTESAGNTSLLKPSGKFDLIDPAGAVVRETVSVPVVTIDRWAKGNGDTAIQVMKFDIQGYELAALKGAVQTLQTSTLLIYSEIWFHSVYDGGTTFSEIDGFLREHGFVLYDIYKPKYNRNGLIQWANALYVHAKRLEL